MTTELVKHYVNTHPRDVARVLETAKSDDAARFMATASTAEQALLLNYLLPQTATRFLSDIDAGAAAAVIEKVRVGTAAPLLAALPTQTRKPVLDALSVEKREAVLHLLRYPDDSVGSLMLTNTLVCRNSASVRRAKQLVRRYASTELPIVIVVNDDMFPVGLVAVSTLMSVRERESVKDHMRAVRSRLRTRAELRTILANEIWGSESHLPVIESDGRYVGLLSRADVYNHAISAQRNQREQNLLGDTVLALAELAWRPGAELMARAALGETEKPDE